MAEIHCIINPASRDYRCGKKWPEIQELLVTAGFSVHPHMTERVGHAAQIAWDLRQQGVKDLIVAVGGDGTSHEVASALRGSEIPMGIIPFGSGNDYAITHGIPRNDLESAVQILRDGKDRWCAAWRLEGYPAEATTGYPSPSSNQWDGPSEHENRVVRWVFLESDAGITSAISRAKLKRAKWIKGQSKYTYLGVTTIPFWPRRKLELKFDDEDAFQCNLTMLAATTGETFGGGYKVSPGVNPSDENGTVIIAPKLSRLQMLKLMGPVKKGKHIGKWGIYAKTVNKIQIRPVNQDGEPMDEPIGVPTWVQADGEPCIMAPAILEWKTKQILVRGAQSVPWD